MSIHYELAERTVRMSEMSIKKVFRQHNSRVVTLPLQMRRLLGIEAGDYVVFEWEYKSGFVKVYKWHRGVERSYADYATENIRDRGRAKQAKGGSGR